MTNVGQSVYTEEELELFRNILESVTKKEICNNYEYSELMCMRNRLLDSRSKSEQCVNNYSDLEQFFIYPICRNKLNKLKKVNCYNDFIKQAEFHYQNGLYFKPIYYYLAVMRTL